MAEKTSHDPGVTPRADVADLTARQADCLRWAGQGMSSKEIGRKLGISPSTVDNHIQAAVTKLQAKNRWQAAQMFSENLIDNGPNDTEDPCLIPPLGGRPNEYSARSRLAQITVAALLAVVAVSALITAVLGLLHVFGTR